MIKVTINKERSGRIQSFEMSGHANFDVHGKDLVCAGASAVSFGALNAIFELTKGKPVIDQGADGGYLKASFSTEEIVNDRIQLILESMVVSLKTIEQNYGQHLKIIFNE